MKTIFTILLCNFLGISIFAQSTQSVNIVFNGINQNTKNYKLIFNGNNFFSKKTDNRANNQTTAVVNDLEPSKYTIKVYRLGSNNPKNNNTSKETWVYSKTFDLREGYDMDI